MPSDSVINANFNISNNSANSSDGIQYSIGGNSGYVGYSMSVRARNAYDDGRKPISKFTREDLDSFNAMLEENGIDTRVNSMKAFKDILSSWQKICSGSRLAGARAEGRCMMP